MPAAEAQPAPRLEAADQAQDVQLPMQTGFQRPEAELRRQAVAQLGRPLSWLCCAAS